MMRAAAMMGVLLAATSAAVAQEKQTVASLLAQGYQVVGAIATPAGGGLFLQNKDRVTFCVVAETPASPEVTTRYCKPVR